MRAIAIALVMLAPLPVSAARRRAIVVPVPPGPCIVRGLANLHVSADGGRTFSQNGEPPAFSGTRGVAVFEDEPQSLVIAVDSSVYDSANGGCTWSLRYTLSTSIHHPLRSVAGSRGRAYVWTEELALRYNRGDVQPMALPGQIGALGVDPANPDHIRIATLERAQLYESFDGGSTWTRIGVEGGAFVAAGAFDPADFNHILLGLQSRGLLVTRDAGKKWSMPATAFNGAIYPCQLQFVRSAPNVIWAVTVTRAGQPSIYRSTNGGSQFEAIGPLDGLENGVCMPIEPLPFNPNLAIVPFGKLRTFDAVTKSVTESSCCGIDVSRITFSPVDENAVYVYGR